MNPVRGLRSVGGVDGDGSAATFGQKKSPGCNRDSGLQLPSSADQIRGQTRTLLTGADLFKYRAAERSNGRGDNPLFRQGPSSSGRGMPAKAVHDIIDGMKAGAANIKVVQSAKELPRAILDEAKKQNIPLTGIRGAHHLGISYLVADNLKAREVQAVGQGAGGIASPDNRGVDYMDEIRPLDQLLRDANTSLDLDGRGRIGLVAQAWAQASRYGGERGGQGGAAVQGATSARAGREEQARLVAAAKEHGFFIGLGHPLFEALEAHEALAGEEHEAYIVGEDRNRVVIRQTKRGEFGNTSKYSPVKYLKRLEEYSQLFPALQTRVIGVHEDADGLVSIFTAQQFVQGEEFDSQNELDAAMRANGWYRLGMNDYEYTHKDTGAVIGDAHTGNVLHIGNELFPIDVIVEKMPKASGGKVGGPPMFPASATIVWKPVDRV